MILDEPTGGLDPLVHGEFIRIIADTKAEGRTVFFYHYGSAIENGIDWTNFTGVAFCAPILVLLAGLVFDRSDIHT